jgi:hypothetical protein
VTPDTPSQASNLKQRVNGATDGFAWRMDLRQVFAANLRRLRRAKGLSQEDIELKEPRLDSEGANYRVVRARKQPRPKGLRGCGQAQAFGGEPC